MVSAAAGVVAGMEILNLPVADCINHISTVCGEDQDFIPVFRQTKGSYPSSTADWGLGTLGSVESDQYSILSQLESYRQVDGSLIFKMVWPNGTVDDGISRNVTWSQTTNPTVQSAINATTVDGFKLIRDTTTQGTPSSTSVPFGGLAKSSSRFALLDGNPGLKWWFKLQSYSHR